MSNFPKLVPAFTTQIEIDAPLAPGSVSKSGPLNVVPFKPNSGSVKSEDSYPIKFDAIFSHGSDFIRTDASGKHCRLQVTSVLTEKSGAIISYAYTGIIKLTPEIIAVLTGSPSAKTTGFGNIAAHVSLETGDESLRALEEKVFVGSGRFIVEPGRIVVEYKVSEVVP